MFGRLLEPHIRRMKHTAADLVAGLDDRSRLLALELGDESRWLALVWRPSSSSSSAWSG